MEWVLLLHFSFFDPVTRVIQKTETREYNTYQTLENCISYGRAVSLMSERTTDMIIRYSCRPKDLKTK